MASDEQVAEALKAAINAQLPAAVRALDPDEHKGLNRQHVQFGCANRYVVTRRSGSESVKAYRITTRVVGDTISNVRETQRRVDLALLDRQVAIEGRDTSPITRETQDQPEPDEGLYSALTTWTFTH